MKAKQPTRGLGLLSFLFCALIGSAVLMLLALNLHHSYSTSPAAKTGSIAQPFLQPANGSTMSATGRAQSPDQRLLAAYGNLPIAFEPNQGQTDPQVKYLARGQGYTLFLTSGEAVFSMPVKRKSSSLEEALMHKRMGPAKIMKAIRRRQKRQQQRTSVASLRMRMLGANPQPVVAAADQQPGKMSYMIGRDPKNWHTNIPLFGQVHYQDIYPGVDMVFHGTQQLEFDFVVNAGANPDRIKLGFAGTQRLRTEKSGDLVLTSAAGEMRLMSPVAYQERNGVREPVKARFVVERENEVHLALGPYDRTRQLVIDPAILFSTYLGGSAEDEGQGLALDASGNVYITGQTGSDDFPGTSGTNITSNVVFLSQITPSGTLGFTALFGGTGGDDGTAVAVDSTGIYVAGITDSSDFPVTTGAAQTHFCGGGPNGSNDGFAAKITSAGSAITWATFITDANCGTGTDSTLGLALAVDSSQDVYVVGETFDAGLPVINFISAEGGALNEGLGSNGADDGFIAELNSAGSAYLIMSYIGGTAGDIATGVAWQSVSGVGTVYVSGETDSTNLPTINAFQPTCGTDGTCNSGSPGGPYDDAFVASFSPSNTGNYIYLTYLGGELSDDAFAITADSSGDAYVTGQTASTMFRVLNPYQPNLGGTGAVNAFVTKFDPAGTSLIYSTYLGGSGSDLGASIALDSSDNAYITGPTTSSNFPQVDATQPFGGGNSGQFDTDAFVSQLNWSGSALSLPFSTFLGGSGDEDVIGGFLGLDGSGNLYVTGDTNSSNFPLTPSPLDGELNAGVSPPPGCTINNINIICPDAFVVKYSGNAANLSQITVTIAGGGAGTVTSSPSGINCPGTCFANFTNGTKVTLTATPAAGSTFDWGGACSGSSTCTLTLTSNELVTATFNGNASFTLTASALSPSSVAAGGSATSTITITPTGGFNASTVALSCSSITPSVSQGPVCTFGNIQLVNGVGTSTLTVSTAGTSGQLTPPSMLRAAPFYALLLPIGAIAFLGAGFSSTGPRKKKLLGWLLVCLVLSGLIFMAACSNNGSSSSTGTPAGAYTITVSGTAGTINTSASPLTLTVQ